MSLLSLSELTDLFGLFSSGIGIGILLLSLFFILGTVIAFLYSIIARA